MKKIIISTLISITFLVIASLICSIVVSYLQYFKSVKINNYVIQIISILFFILSGMIYGFINKKQGLLGSILFILVYIFALIIFNFIDKNEKHNMYYFFVFSKCFAYMIGAIISVNIVKR